MPDPSTGGKESGTETLRASCPKSDLYKSFSLILKDRTYVITCFCVFCSYPRDTLKKTPAVFVAEQTYDHTNHTITHSVDFTCHSIEQMTYLLKGITTLMAEQKRALLKARAAAATAEAPASPGRTTAAY